MCQAWLSPLARGQIPLPLTCDAMVVPAQGWARSHLRADSQIGQGTLALLQDRRAPSVLLTSRPSAPRSALFLGRCLPPACPLLTEARLWEEPERLLGSMEEMPLRVSLLLLLGLCTLRLE